MRDLGSVLDAAVAAQPSSLQDVPVQAAADAQQLQATLKEAAVKFEAFFVAQMMKQMRQATAELAGEDSPFNKEVNQAPLAMADMAVADDLAGQHAFGIADVLVRQMSNGLNTTPTDRGIARNQS